MDTQTFKILAAAGMLLYGSLYLIGVFVLAALAGNRFAEAAAIATAGASYLCFHLGWRDEPIAAAFFSGFSVLGGIAAGLFLLVF